MAYTKQLNPTRKSARRESADIALGGVAQVVVGGLIVVGSYYWFKHADYVWAPGPASWPSAKPGAPISPSSTAPTADPTPQPAPPPSR